MPYNYLIDNMPKIDRQEAKFKVYQWEESPLSFFNILIALKMQDSIS